MNLFIINREGDIIPKLIDNIREKLLREARRDLFENGYRHLNIRDIAKACHIAAGTVYNYFPSKEMLAANVVLEDWCIATSKMRVASEQCACIDEGLSSIYGCLSEFYGKYRGIFAESAVMPLHSSFTERHFKLRAQIADMICLVIGRFGEKPDPFLCDFISENFLSASGEEWSYEKFSPFIMKLIN